MQCADLQVVNVPNILEKAVHVMLSGFIRSSVSYVVIYSNYSYSSNIVFTGSNVLPSELYWRSSKHIEHFDTRVWARMGSRKFNMDLEGVEIPLQNVNLRGYFQSVCLVQLIQGAKG